MNAKIIALIILMVFVSAVGVSAMINMQPKDDSDNELIGGQKDENGCLVPAGYSWNDDVGACLREWELDEQEKKAAEIAAPKEYKVTVVGVSALRCPGCFDVEFQRNDNQERFIAEVRNWNLADKNQERNPEEIFGIEKFYIDYTEGNVAYDITIVKPTPCYSLSIRQDVMESYPAQIRFDITVKGPEEDEMCAQVLTPETLSGSIAVGHKPGLISVYINGKEVYSTTLDEHHVCTEEEKNAQMCTMEYSPVCGFKEDGTSKTYGNGCSACSDKAEYWIPGEC